MSIVSKLFYILFDGMFYASWLFLVALGLTFAYGVLRVLNVAHGSLYAVGAYAASWLVMKALALGYPLSWSYLLLVGAPVATGLVLGPFLERVFLRRVYLRDEVQVLLLTFALLLMFEDAIKLVWGVQPYNVNAPYLALGEFSVGGVAYSRYLFLLVGASAASGCLLWLGMSRTRFGKLVVAVIEDREVSAALGVNVSAIFVVAFTLATVLAALGGALTAPVIAVVPGIAVEVIVLAFAVVAIGGLGSIPGAAVGSTFVGLLRATAVHVLPELELLVVFGVMGLVLLFRPQGLFGEVQVRRV